MKLGTVIAQKFRIDRVIGRGAMGVVVEAMDTTMGRRVAVKLILPHYAEDPQLRGRFVREANVMTRLRTEHVAQVLEVGELDDGMLFLAMELLEGQSLEQLIQSGGPLPVADAVDLVLEALDAVAEAHDLGLVHRDLKPSNLFLAARRPRVATAFSPASWPPPAGGPILKVLDFGIVKDSAAATKLTATGTLPGTPAYMAPEQVAMQEELIDARADIWALGVTLYEILTGELPFQGPLNVLLTRIRTEAAPRLRGRRPDVAPELEAIIDRCLAKHPAERFASGRELARALADLRTRGLVRTERGQERDNVATAVSLHREARKPRQTAATEAEPTVKKKPGTRGVILLVFAIAVCAIASVAVWLGVRARSRSAEVLPVASATSFASVAPSPVPSVVLIPMAETGIAPALSPSTPSVVASGPKRGRKVRVVSARNTGDRAWRSWIDRRRPRLETCALRQPCAVTVPLRITRAEGKTTSTIEALPSDACGLSGPARDCLTEVLRDAIPAPDVCTDPSECHADVLLALD